MPKAYLRLILRYIVIETGFQTDLLLSTAAVPEAWLAADGVFRLALDTRRLSSLEISAGVLLRYAEHTVGQKFGNISELCNARVSIVLLIEIIVA